MTTGSGEATAEDAEVSTDDRGSGPSDIEVADRAVAGCERKVEKQRAHLAAAEEALAEAVAARDALGG